MHQKKMIIFEQYVTYFGLFLTKAIIVLFLTKCFPDVFSNYRFTMLKPYDVRDGVM